MGRLPFKVIVCLVLEIFCFAFFNLLLVDYLGFFVFFSIWEPFRLIAQFCSLKISWLVCCFALFAFFVQIIFVFTHRSIINLQKDDDVWDICHLKKNVCLVVDFLWVEQAKLARGRMIDTTTANVACAADF